MQSSHEIDFCHGPLLRQTLVFSFPLLLSCLLELSFNAADLLVVGRFASVEALDAVGATVPLCALLTTIGYGLSVGANVIVAHAFGAMDRRRTRRAVHTSMAVSVVSGFAFLVLSLLASPLLLRLMDVPADVFPLAVRYMTIFSVSILPMMFYIFGSAILRAVGDTRRPLYYLAIAGVTNVVLNLLFVREFHMDVAGVAWATVVSQLLSALLVGVALCRERGLVRLIPTLMRFDPVSLRQLLRIGFPAGIQGTCFAISNMTIQGAVNSLGKLALAGSTVAVSLEGFIYIIGYAFSQAVVSIVGQNRGGNQPDRIRKSIWICHLSASALMIAFAIPMIAFGPEIVHLFTPDPGAVRWAMERFWILLPLYFICAMMDILSGALRGLGSSIAPTVIAFVCVILLRIVWVFAVFPHWRTMPCLMISYPLSWALATIASQIVFNRIFRSLYGRRHVQARPD